jgi:hypothetical protein
LQTPAISDTLVEISYAISIDSSVIVAKYSFEEIKRVFFEFLSKTNFLLSKQHKGQAQSIDIRAAVKELIFSDSKTIVLTLLVSQSQGLRLREVMETILEIPEEDLKTLSICKIRMKLRE